MHRRPEVEAFADLMEAKLKENDHKVGWKRDLSGNLLARVREEVRELQDAITAYPRHTADYTKRIGEEAADIANFCMMIADVEGALELP